MNKSTALTIAIKALTKIAAFDDEGANQRHHVTGSYSSFDEPGSVETAREALAMIDGKPTKHTK